MRCLWLTRKYPRPVNSGELIYSHGMISAFAGTGVDLTVIAHDNEESPVGDGSEDSRFTDSEGVEWRLGHPELGGRLGSLLTPLPADSYRLRNGGPGDALAAALNETWDAVVVDHAAMGWALDSVLRGRNGSKSPRVVYLSHNHEAKIRREIAKHSTTESLPRRLAMRVDADKYARQERDLCQRADLVTAITDFEVEAYREEFPDQRYLVLTPGYDGERHPAHEITEDTPRRVVMSGSFEWIAKRINLEGFLETAAVPLAEAGIELQIVGKTEEAFRQRIAERFPSIDFVGRVPEMSPFLLDARMGLIVETLGGGFKLKSLDYLYHRLPLAGLRHAVEGLPHQSPEEVLLVDTLETLVAEIVSAIDDLPRLNRMSRESYRKCETSFQWKDRGWELFEAIGDLGKNSASCPLPR